MASDIELADIPKGSEIDIESQGASNILNGLLLVYLNYCVVVVVVGYFIKWGIYVGGDHVCLIHVNSFTDSNNSTKDTTGDLTDGEPDADADTETHTESNRRHKPTKIILYTDQDSGKDCLSPISDHRHLLKNKVNVSEDANKRIVKLVRAFYYFPKPHSNFLQFEIVLAKLSTQHNMYKIYPLKNLHGEPLDVPKNKALALTPNIWKYGVKNKQFNPVNFIEDLIKADRPELIELAYLQLPVLDLYLSNPFHTSERRK